MRSPFGHSLDNQENFMFDDFAGKNVVITGGGGGIGAALGEAFLAAGAQVALIDVGQEALQKVAEANLAAVNAGQLLTVVTDIRSDDSVAAAMATIIDAFGDIHILVNNAAIVLRGLPASEIPMEAWQSVMDVNFFGTVRCTNALLPNMQAHGQPAKIVNIASAAGFFASGRGTAAYGASKFAVVVFSEDLEIELAQSNVDVCIVAPAAVATQMYVTSAQFLDEITEDKAALENTIKVPTADIRAGMKPAEMANKILTALKTDAFYIMTHSEVMPLVKKRHSRILGAFK
jgi:NAD(P)-dependent dehydrogenase (short-subunit alcohol dehydrogenase family)